MMHSFISRKFLKICNLNLLLVCSFILIISGANRAFSQDRPLLPVRGKVDLQQLMAAPAGLADMSEGDANAPVTIIEYGSLTCGHCGHFFLEVFPKIKEKYIKAGKVRYIFREFPTDGRAMAGFMLTRCVAKEKYYPLLEELYQKASQWAFADDARVPVFAIAQKYGFDENTFKACLQNKGNFDKIEAGYKNAYRLGVTALPTFFINGNKYIGEMTFEETSALIDYYLQLASNNNKKN